MIVHSDESMHVRDSAIMLNKTVSFPMDQTLHRGCPDNEEPPNLRKFCFFLSIFDTS